MKLNRIKGFPLFFILLFISIISVFLFKPTQVIASCGVPEDSFVASYNQGVYIDAFTLVLMDTGLFCDYISVVSNNVENLPKIASDKFKDELTTGVYKMSLPDLLCKDNPGVSFCQKPSIEQLSSNHSELSNYKRNFIVKEIIHLLSVIGIILLVIAINMIAVLYPWLVLRYKKIIKHEILLFIFSIILQIISLALLYSLFGGTLSSYFWQRLFEISYYAISIIILIEIIYIIYLTYKVIKSKLNKN